MLLLIIAILSGLGFMNFLPKNINGHHKLLLYPSLGLIIFTHLTLLFSFVFGLNYFSIIISLIVLLILNFFLIIKYPIKIATHSSSFTFWIITIPLASLLAFIWSTQTLAASSIGLKTGGGGMFGDTALHAAYASRLETGEFPIQNPLFAGTTLVYPIANDLLSATLKIAGLSFNLAFILPQIIFLLGFMSLFYSITRKLSSNLGFIFTSLIFFLGWGIGYYFVINEWQIAQTSFWEFLKQDFSNNSLYNLYFHNILTGLILPERSFLPGLLLGSLFFSYFIEYFEEKRTRLLIINGAILGILPFWHTHTFIFFSITSVIFAIYLLIKNFQKTLYHFSLMLFTTLIFASPFLWLFFANHPLTKFIHFSLGWQNGHENIFVFWLKNSFLTIPLATIGFLFTKKHLRIFFVPAFAIFIIANLIIFQPWDWDNIKLLSWSFLFFAILAGFALSKFFQISSYFRILVILITFTSIVTGILSIALQLKNQYIIYDNQDIQLANWIKKNTNNNDVFIIDPTPNNPVPGLAGRLVYLGYPGHLWVHGINYKNREVENNKILGGDFSQIDNLELPISYVVLPKNKIYFENQPNLYEVLQNQKYRVLKVIE